MYVTVSVEVVINMVVLAFSGDIVNVLMVPELSETDGGENDGFVYASIVMSVGQLERTGFVTSKKINIYCEQHDVFGCSFFLLSWLSKYI